MGWVKRGNRKYYYRSRRVNGRVVKEYLGCGPEAEEAARRDAAEREYRKKSAALAAVNNELKERTKLLIAATMYAAGYHRHDRGRWRKRRVKPQ